MKDLWTFLPFFLATVALWDLVWRGLGLWRSAKQKQKYWFIAILILSTAGILPIIYLAFFQKEKRAKKK